MALFENLTARLSRTVDTLRGRGRITEENVGESLREVRMALLEADVALPVIKAFIERVKQKALGRRGHGQPLSGTGLSSASCTKELVALMGGERPEIRAARAAARGGVVSRPAGRGQDHDRRQSSRAGSSSRRRSACC
jgi:signal recognition particle subunit SRP54